MRERGFSWTGVLLILVGLWLLLRTVRQDSGGHTLVDHILGNVPKAEPPPPSSFELNPPHIRRLGPRSGLRSIDPGFEQHGRISGRMPRRLPRWQREALEAEGG